MNLRSDIVHNLTVFGLVLVAIFMVGFGIVVKDVDKVVIGLLDFLLAVSVKMQNIESKRVSKVTEEYIELLELVSTEQLEEE